MCRHMRPSLSVLTMTLFNLAVLARVPLHRYVLGHQAARERGRFGHATAVCDALFCMHLLECVTAYVQMALLRLLECHKVILLSACRWLQRIDSLEGAAQLRALAGGLLAGNCFDWGAQVRKIVPTHVALHAMSNIVG